MPQSYDYFSAGMRGGDEGLEEIAGPALDSEEAEGEGNRRAQLRDADPVGAMHVGASLREGLSAAASLHGPALDAALGRLDEHVMASTRWGDGSRAVAPVTVITRRAMCAAPVVDLASDVWQVLRGLLPGLEQETR
ncbi:hypothetical protein TSOC_015063, partial [Tetrabaena socialis]